MLYNYAKGGNMDFEDTIKKIGNSRGIILPITIWKALNFNVGDKVIVTVDNNRLIITKK